MKLPATEDPKARRQDGRWRRIVRRTFYAKLGIAFAILLVAFACYLRLVAGPVSLVDYSDRVARALADRIGPGWRVALADTAIELQGAVPAVRTAGLEVRNPAGQLVMRAPYAVVSLDPGSLFLGAFVPREIELRDLQLVAQIAADGSLFFVAPPEASGDAAAASPERAAPVPGQPPLPAADDAPSSVSRAVTSLLEPVLGSASLIGALDRATVANARLTVLGADGRERAAFNRVNAMFERAGDGLRRMSIALDGPGGTWRIAGQVGQAAAGVTAELEAANMPLQDALLLAGMSSFPAVADLKLSGSVTATLSEGRLSRFDGRLESSSGSIAPPGQKPIPLELLSVATSWDEAARIFDLSDLAVKSGATEARLRGRLASRRNGSWALSVAGTQASWAGATEREPAFEVAELAAEATLEENGVALDRLTFKGEGLDIAVSGATTPAPDGTGLRGLIEAKSTGVRRFLAFWPGAVNPELRGFLSQNLGSGTLDTMRLRAELDGADLKRAFSGKPISDRALELAFTVSDARLSVIEGLPPLRRLEVVGSATGTTTTLTARQGRIDMPDGRRLSFTEASYRQTEEDKPTSVADINFRLDGGADALASLLRSPIFREVGSFDMDPASVRGRADLRVSLSLPVHRIPPIAELPVKVTGALSDLSIDGVAGKEKLEGAQLALSYQSGALSIRGEGRLGGSPASFDLRQPRAAPGEAIVHLTLDEAARTRRALPSAPHLAGPVAVKVVAPFGPNAKGPPRLEADLSKASVEGLLPGWSKPAGRPGKLSFAFGEGTGTDLRDLVLESGPVQLRGTASFAPDGTLDKAELGTFKLSPGDDMRASVDRGGGVYRVMLRGNVGDVRPVLRSLTGSGPGGGTAAAKGREPPDLDIDAALNIVTGHNDEALTGVVARIGTRGRDLRALQLRGQFRSAVVEAQLAREAGQPQLLVRSGDAGATLRFLDLYNRMVGGELVVKTSMGEVQSGSIAIGNFAVRNEPALRRIAANTSEVIEERSGAAAKRLEADQVDFVKLDAEFKRSASRVEYKDVVVWGAQVGFTLGGYVDYARDRTEIFGTFVPAYGLNNAFSQVPIVGLLLGGGNKNEGLFAIDFKVSGQASAPTLTVNPLTAVAPGILRKLFSWMMPEDEATGATTAPPVAPERRTRPPRAPKPARAE